MNAQTMKWQRALIAMLVLGFPILLVAKAGEQASLSAFYHTQARDWFVGLNFLTAGALLSYRGYDRGDWTLSTIIALALVTLAVNPVPSPVHTAAGLVMAVGMTAYSIRFMRGETHTPGTQQKATRNLVYALGTVMSGVVTAWVFGSTRPTLAGEVVLMMIFAVVWGTKAGLWMADKTSQ
jgi:hypothetical protein